MTSQPEQVDDRERAHETAHRGIGGELRLTIPDLDGCMAALCNGNTDFLEVLSGMHSGYSEKDRIDLLDQLILTLGGFYVHLPMKWAKHAADPVRALSALRQVCSRMDDLEFHSSVARIFKSLRDIHTAYILPEPYRSSVWFLPFTLRAYWEKESSIPIVVVDRMLEGFPEPSFRRGTEILTWNGQPIEQAVRTTGREESGSNSDAEFAIGLRMMTVRWLGGSIAPDSHWVTIGYLDPIDPNNRTASRSYHEIRLSWRRLSLDSEEPTDWQIDLQAALGLESRLNPRPAVRSVKTPPHRPSSVDLHGHLVGLIARNVHRNTFGDTFGTDDTVTPIETCMPAVFEAQHRSILANGAPVEFGYLRIAHFMVDSTEDFVNEFVRILQELPPDRLMIDLRSNAGGNPHCAERVMQFLTSRPVEPLPFEFRATPEADAWLNGRNAKDDPDFGRWGQIVHDSAVNGFMFSPSRTLTTAQQANSSTFKYKYQGAVALLVDAITYSTGDIFAALFKDHEVGPIIGMTSVTGGGGADMMDHAEIVERAPEGLGFRPLPHGAEMHLAIRRFLRVGASAGMPVEETGVAVDLHHRTTFDDFCFSERDLMLAALDALRVRFPGLRGDLVGLEQSIQSEVTA